MATDQASANRNIRLAGGFLVGIGAMSLLTALIALMASAVLLDAFAGESGAEAEAAMAAARVTVMVMVLASGLTGGLTIWGGIGMVRGAPWGKTMGYVASGVQLINIPLGTAAGVFGFIALGDTLANNYFEENNATA